MGTVSGAGVVRKDGGMGTGRERYLVWKGREGLIGWGVVEGVGVMVDFISERRLESIFGGGLREVVG